MDGPPRSLYAWTFADAVPVAPTVAGIEIRRVLDDDDGALGRLMERAYAGTIDENLGENSDGEVEIRDWRDSGGRPDESAVAVRDGAAVSACLITLGASGNWWVAYVFSDPATKALGVGASVVAAAVQRVRAAGAADAPIRFRQDGSDLNRPSCIDTGPVRACCRRPATNTGWQPEEKEPHVRVCRCRRHRREA